MWIRVFSRDMPVFARSGAIVPLASRTSWSDTANPDALDVHVFPQQSRRFELYEDDGETTADLRGHCCLTLFDLTVQAGGVAFTVELGQGDLSVVPQQRTYRLIFHCVTPPAEGI